MIKDHHEGYISWDEYERNQKQLAINNYGSRRRRQVRTGRQGAAVGDHDLRAMRPAAKRRLHRQSAKPAGISLRQAKPYDGPAPVHDLRRSAG